MFTYLHSYMPETWDAQVKAGLINQNAGVRFCQSIDIEERLKFNVLAKKGGALYEMLRIQRLPFYIDRLQGGCFLEKYPYDMALVVDYKQMLGDRFWGFQMHEWMSNYKSDLGKLIRNNCPAWTAPAITETIQQAFPFPHVFLEAMSAEEMAMHGNPAGHEDFYKAARWLFADRQAYTGGYLLPCDSAFLAYKLELENGMRRLMPEIGAQTPNTRIQVAYARGMTKAYGAHFGTYYEPWGGSPFSACCYHREKKNEWNIGSSKDFPFETKGENGGSSRSMQARLHLYSYFAGAEFMAEEWGMCNTFYDWHDFELTPYGRVKLDFIRFTEKYPDIGRPVTPIAVVLPKEVPLLDAYYGPEDTLFGFPVTGTLAEKLRLARTGLQKLFMDTEPMLGTETTSLLNGRVPDALDIVHEDRCNAAAYDYLVDLTGSSALAAAFPGKVCTVEDVPGLLEKLLPCTCTGGALQQLTRREDGSYYLLLTNNSGVVRSVEHGEQFLEEARGVVRVQPKPGVSLQKEAGSGSLSCCGTGYVADIPAGGWLLARLGK